ncbi:hypothetical protein RSK20926_01312 [Roseobacter sp. SK209-2-6]|uniref:hypothetical protein n=1 Tax=Roseobacter sp. SK209-2-6 TaxID=388739 RepID=UPI0000F3F4B2|nr:hypothetical protein [Roseobacter sp. SK209-2-6]EBA14591.1 hypothetical protein RSK20926_01312 [Roseobacter sp. SK209-2-6]
MRLFEQTRLFGPFLGICLFLSGMPEQGAAMSKPETRPVISLSCKVTAPEGERLCQALLQALSKEAPKAVIRRVETAPQDVEGALISLRAEAKSRDQINGRLSWTLAPGAEGNGAEVRFDVMDDAKLSAKVYDGFARGLIVASPELQQALRAAGVN